MLLQLVLDTGNGKELHAVLDLFDAVLYMDFAVVQLGGGPLVTTKEVFVLVLAHLLLGYD